MTWVLTGIIQRYHLVESWSGTYLQVGTMYWLTTRMLLQVGLSQGLTPAMITRSHA